MPTTIGDEIMEDLLLLGDEEDDSAQTMTAADLALLDASFHVVDKARWTLSASLSLALAAEPERHVALFPNIGARNYRYLTSLGASSAVAGATPRRLLDLPKVTACGI